MIAKLIHVLAAGGMGKSTALKHLAMSWAEGTIKPLVQFHFLFHLELKRVRDNRSIENIIVQQHCDLEGNNVRPEEIKYLLDGNTNSKILLIMDGHDEYKIGTNTDVDRIIEKRKRGNCCLILTSRETEKSPWVKEFMDNELEIHGFDTENGKKYITAMLNNEEKTTELLEQASANGLCVSHGQGNFSFISTLLQIPIILNMICVLFLMAAILPKTKTQIIYAMIKRYIDRENIRMKGQAAVKNFEDTLRKLGKLAWMGILEGKQTFEKVKNFLIPFPYI